MVEIDGVLKVVMGRSNEMVRMMQILRLAVVFGATFAVSASMADDAGVVVERILDRLEARGKTVSEIDCEVVYRVTDLISDDVRKNTGRVLFRKMEPNPQFLVTFEKTVFDGQVNLKKSWHLFDGRFLFEASQRSRSIIKRDVAPPGTELDLFSIDKAPFPMPFGQKKAEILKHFDVRLGECGKDAPADTDRLVCTPKAGSKLAADYSVMEFFVSRKLSLPVRIVMTDKPGDKIITADFPNLSDGNLNTGLDVGRFKLPDETRTYTPATE